SRVLYLCHIPNHVTDAEIISLGLPFGRVTNVMLLKGRHQAFLEMASGEAAVNMMQYYTSVMPVLGGQPVHIQLSNHKELQTSYLFVSILFPFSRYGSRAARSRNWAAAGAGAAGGGRNPTRTPVIRIIVENAFYPITLEMLYQFFSKYGYILRILIFTRHNRFQVLLEYSSPVSASYAKRFLNGQNLFNTCSVLHIEFSRLPKLTIKYNNEKSRDFTRLDLPPGNIQEYLESPLLPSGFVPPNAILPPHMGAAGFFQRMGFTQGPGLPFPVVPGVIHSVPVTPAAVPGLRAVQNVPGILEGSVLQVRNFNFEVLRVHGLFILFGVYGNVLCVKVMKKRETALIQMMDEAQAHLAIIHLNGQQIYGRVLQVRLSECQTIHYPQWGQEDQEEFVDYYNSPLHRFKRPGSKNSQNLSAPSDTLHLCGIPYCATEGELKKLFSTRGYTVKAFRFLKRDCKMALIRLGSMEEAIQSLIELHGHDFGGDCHLRISFSKMKI
ncbi:Polypyrimidine tract-binding protein 3, partial [Dryobates pubescens]